MLFQCSRVLANFPTEKLRLVNQDQARLVWDEHGGTYVLRLEGLEVLEAPEGQGEAGIRLEAVLPETLAGQIESFAREHNLRLGTAAEGPEFSESPILAACHLPAKNLFIFSEEPRLTVRRRGSAGLEMKVSGVFKARRVPCQEADVVIHLEPAGMGRLLAGILAWSREGQ